MSAAEAYNASCHCGAVQIEISHKPDFMHDCNCDLCRKSGGIWGYYSPSDVQVSGPTLTYSRTDIPLPAVQIHFCTNCGSTTHWVLTEGYIKQSGGNDQMGVNMRLFAAGDLIGVELRFPDGKAWNGKDAFKYRNEAIRLGSSGFA